MAIKGAALARNVAYQVLSIFTWPFVAAHAVQAAVLGADRSLIIFSELLSLLPDGVGTLMRRRFYAAVLVSSGSSCNVSFGSVFSKTGARLGDDVYIGRYCAIGLADIGSDVLIGDGVHLLSGRRHHVSSDNATLIRKQRGEFTKILVGDGAWIGSGALVMADVGAHAIVGAGSVVIGPVPDYAVVVGNPARVVRDRRANNGVDQRQ